MSALNRVNIPMYGVLKSATTPFVLVLDYILREKKSSSRIQMAVFMTTFGAFVAGVGDLTFDFAGYVLALSSAMATAAYVVIVGKLGEELQLDSFTLLLYNNCWSLPFSFLLVLTNGEWPALKSLFTTSDFLFLFYFLTSCASAFVLNLATYLCTLVNDSLTTSIVGTLFSSWSFSPLKLVKLWISRAYKVNTARTWWSFCIWRCPSKRVITISESSFGNKMHPYPLLPS